MRLAKADSNKRWASMRAGLLVLLCAVAGAACGDEVSIGVLSHRGDETAHTLWDATADYLSRRLPDNHFSIVPLDFQRVDEAVAEGQVDFILVNPAIYVNLEVRHRVSRIATLQKATGNRNYNTFGGVIFARAERYDLNELRDLVNATFMAVDETSLGGFLMALREFKAEQINPYRDFFDLSFAGTHDKVVIAVRDGLVDAGTVRTDILERMASEGTISLDEFRILNPHHDENYPYKCSTRLYPEWPFSKVRHTSNLLASRVAVALAEMPSDDPAAQHGGYAGWTIPLDYQPVHDLLQELQLPPYQYSGRFTLIDVAHRYWAWLVSGLGILLAMGGMTTWVWRLNRALAQAKARLEQQHELILNSVGDGIYGVDLKGNSTFVNAAMQRMTGWGTEELIGHNQHELLHHTRADGTAHPGAECPVYHTFRDNVPRFVEDDIFWRRDGTSFPVEYSTNPIRDEHGGVHGAVVVFRDITERKRAAEEARQHQIELAHVARLSTMGEMASGIAHELNQPLAAISNYAHGSIRMLARDDLQREALRDAMERVASQAERAGEIIRQLRRFIRKERPELQRVAVERLVRNLVQFLQPELRRAGIAIQLELKEPCPSVMAHEIQLEQVLLNLTRNAMEAMQGLPTERRRLRIRAYASNGALWMEVQDWGHGIQEALFARLFEPFITTKPNGMGLGLSISRGIIEAHGGTLTATTEVEQGSRFIIQLPLEEG